MSRRPHALLTSCPRAQRHICAAALAMIAIAGTVVSARDCQPHSGIYAARDDDKDLVPRIENSTFPTWEGTDWKQTSRGLGSSWNTQGRSPRRIEIS